MTLVSNLVTLLSRTAALLAAAIMVAMTILIMTEILLRTFFDTSTYVADELVGYGLAAVTFLGLGYTLSQDGLLRVSLLLKVFPSPLRRVFTLGGMVATLLLTVFLGNEFWRSITSKYRNGTIGPTIAEVPLWIPEMILLIGLGVFLLQLLLEIGIFCLQPSDGRD